MVVNKSYVGDIGTRVRSYLRADITDASGITYYWKKPVSGQTTTEVVTHVAGVEYYPTGVVYYDTEDGDFDAKGEYKHQVLVVFDNGDRFRSHTKTFVVYDYFE